MTFSNIFDRIGSKLIGLKFVSFSISPNLWIGIIIEWFHGFWNTFVTIDILIINVIYWIVTIRLSLICWRLIWSCPVDLVFFSFDIANITSAACTGWGLHNEDFLMIRGCSSSSSQDRPLGPLLAKCWPEAFHATFIHNIRERGKTERMEE